MGHFVNEESKKTRYLFLDNIKVLFTILVIGWHVTVTYIEAGWWYYKETNPVDPISSVFFLVLLLFGGFFQTALLGLFFLLGGYFTPKSYDRKGGPGFWKERLMRLGIPLLLYSVLINPVMTYTLSQLEIPPWSTDPKLQGSLLDYYSSVIQSWDTFIDFLTFSGPMWFLMVLLLFTAIYTLWHQFSKLDVVKRNIPKELAIPRYGHLLLLANCLGVLTFLVRIFWSIDNRPWALPLGQMIPYLMMFSVGVVCIRYRWFEKMTKKMVKLWVITILTAMILVFLDLVFVLGVDADLGVLSGGANIHAFLFALVDNVICMGMIFVLIKVVYAKFNAQCTMLQKLSASAYHMYLLHAPVAVFISLGFAITSLVPLLKVVFVFLLTVLVCYLVSHYIIQKINLKRKRLLVSDEVPMVPQRP